jgi:hypothetical protein
MILSLLLVLTCADAHTLCLAQNTAQYRVDRLDCRADVALDRRDCADENVTELDTCTEDLDVCTAAGRDAERECLSEIATNWLECLGWARDTKTIVDHICDRVENCGREAP